MEIIWVIFMAYIYRQFNDLDCSLLFVGKMGTVTIVPNGSKGGMGIWMGCHRLCGVMPIMEFGSR